VVAAASHVDSIRRFAVTPTERGIVLFEAARKALKQAEAAGRTGYMHEPRHDDPIELVDEFDDDIPESAYEDE
jgi:intracellular multiplication protein IcmO